MDQHNDNQTAQKLMRVFMQFNRVEWHQRTIAGCTMSEIKALFCIKKRKQAETGDIKVSEISKLLHVTSPTITQLLKDLEVKGLVERRSDPADRRTVSIGLTEKGEMVVSEAYETFSNRFQGLIEHLGEEQSNKLADLLSQVFRYFNEKAATENYANLYGGDEA